MKKKLLFLCFLLVGVFVFILTPTSDITAAEQASLCDYNEELAHCPQVDDTDDCSCKVISLPPVYPE